MYKPKLYVTIGLPASGKSYWIEENKNDGERVVSTDSIRAELLGSDEDQSNQELVFKTAHKRIREYLKAGVSVYFDATNLSIKRRKRLFVDYSKYANLYAVYFATPFAECLSRNIERARKVPFQVIERMYLSLQTPSITEGWKDIYVVGKFEFNIPDVNLKKISEEDAFNNEFFGDIYGLEQGNPYHEMTASEHSWRVYSKVFDEQKDKLSEDDFKIITVCALYHDIGKGVAKKWVEDRNRFRYVGHENVSSQKLISFIGAKYSGKEVFTILDLINNHILAHSNPELAEKRVQRPDLLRILNDADINSKKKDGGGYDLDYIRHAL